MFKLTYIDFVQNIVLNTLHSNSLTSNLFNKKVKINLNLRFENRIKTHKHDFLQLGALAGACNLAARKLEMVTILLI